MRSDERFDVISNVPLLSSKQRYYLRNEIIDFGILNKINLLKKPDITASIIQPFPKF